MSAPPVDRRYRVPCDGRSVRRIARRYAPRPTHIDIPAPVVSVGRYIRDAMTVVAVALLLAGLAQGFMR